MIATLEEFAQLHAKEYSILQENHGGPSKRYHEVRRSGLLKYKLLAERTGTFSSIVAGLLI